MTTSVFNIDNIFSTSHRVYKIFVCNFHMIIHLDSIQYIMDNKKAHSEIGFIGLGIMGKPMVKNLLSAGSIPANIAGAPSHLTVMFVEEREEPDNISLSDCRKLIAALTQLTP